MARIAAIILAAGRATRFGAAADASKVLAPLDGDPLVGWVAKAALASRAVDTVVVTGQAGAAVRAALASLPVRCVHNADYAEGMAGSLVTGLASLDADVDGAIVLLADMPRITADIIDRLIAAFAAAGPGTDAVVPVRDGRQGNPVLLGRTLFSAASALRGDRGAKPLLADPQWSVELCPIDDDAIETDVDTPAALAALNRPRAG